MKQKLIIRLDDAAERMDVNRWQKMEEILDRYNIKPLVGVIPDCQDDMMKKYDKDDEFWDKVHLWIKKDWCIALHGYKHVYDAENGGINPVNKMSEFAGHTYEEQAERIKDGLKILESHDIYPKVFFAPGHTFDENTVEALKNESSIRVISDTIARDVYCKDDITYIPVQSGQMRKLPFRTVTYCLHPNTTDVKEFRAIEKFLKDNYAGFCKTDELFGTVRKYDPVDYLLKKLYFMRRRRVSEVK